MRTLLENEAYKLTKAFMSFAGTKFGKRKTRLLSASFDARFENGYAIDGWHGQKSRGYGDLYIIWDIYGPDPQKSFCPIIEFDVANRPGCCTPFTPQDLDDYKVFLENARNKLENL
jgi:hypothetical protein